MSRATILTDIYAMLSTMTTANGYSRTYTPVKSVDNDSATMKQTPWIGFSFGEEEELEEGASFSQYRAMIPVTFVARARAPHVKKSQEEQAVDIERSRVVEDIKKRFSRAYLEIGSCTSFVAQGEEEPREDSNKNCFFTEYTFLLTYKQLR